MTSYSPSTSTWFQRILPKHWYAHLILTVAVVVIGFPMFYALLISTQNNAMVYSRNFTPGPYFLENFQMAWVTRNIGRYMLNSFIIAFSIAFGKTVMSILAGLGLVFFRYTGKWIIFSFVLVTLIMPSDILLIALYRRVIAYENGIVDFLYSVVAPLAQSDWEPHPYYSLILPLLASATGVFVFRQHFMTIPADLSEAAQLDGATPLQFLFQVLIPLSWNTIGALMVIMFLYGWNQYLWPLILLRDQDLYVVQWGVQSLAESSEVGDAFGPMMMAVILTSLPPLSIFLILQRQFTSGFALTRDK